MSLILSCHHCRAVWKAEFVLIVLGYVFCLGYLRSLFPLFKNVLQLYNKPESLRRNFLCIFFQGRAFSHWSSLMVCIVLLDACNLRAFGEGKGKIKRILGIKCCYNRFERVANAKLKCGCFWKTNALKAVDGTVWIIALERGDLPGALTLFISETYFLVGLAVRQIKKCPKSLRDPFLKELSICCPLSVLMGQSKASAPEISRWSFFNYQITPLGHCELASF